MRYVVSVMLLVVGVIHLMPLVGVWHVNKLTLLYGIEVRDPNLEILMRHRAVLFGLLGGVMVVAAFVPRLQATALVMGAVSVASFLYLAWAVGGYNALIARVVAADVVAALCLFIGAGAWFIRGDAA